MPISYALQVEKLLEQHGWEFKRFAKGSHSLWHKPDDPAITHHVSVSNHLKDIHRAHRVLKQAGIDHRLLS